MNNKRKIKKKKRQYGCRIEATHVTTWQKIWLPFVYALILYERMS
jgi:hypothetical protein